MIFFNQMFFFFFFLLSYNTIPLSFKKAFPRAGLEFNLAALAVPSAKSIHEYFFGPEKELTFYDANISRELTDISYSFINFVPPGFGKTHLGQFHISHFIFHISHFKKR